MNREELKNLMPPTPDHFVSRMDETLKEIENMNRKHRKRTGATILLAAAITVLLAGTAVAAANSLGLTGLLFDGVEPLEGAEREIEVKMAEGESEYAHAVVEEAAYISDYVVVSVRVQTAEGTRVDGPYLKVNNAESEPLSSRGGQEFEDGSIRLCITKKIEGEAPDVLECEARLPVYFGEAWDPFEQTGMEPAGEEIVIPIEVSRNDGREVRLIPQGEAAQWSIASAKLNYGRAFSTYEVDVRYEKPDEDAWAPFVELILPDGMKLQETSSTLLPVRQPDGATVYRVTGLIQSPTELPETITIRGKLPDGDPLDAIECRVEIAD